MHRNSISVSTKQERIAALAKQSPEMAFTSLAYLMDIDWLKEAYRRTRKDGAVGVDGVTAEEYEQDLEATFKACSTARSPARTVHHLCGVCTFRKAARHRDASARNSHPGGQSPPEGGRHAVGVNL